MTAAQYARTYRPTMGQASELCELYEYSEFNYL